MTHRESFSVNGNNGFLRDYIHPLINFAALLFLLFKFNSVHQQAPHGVLMAVMNLHSSTQAVDFSSRTVLISYRGTGDIHLS